MRLLKRSDYEELKSSDNILVSFVNPYSYYFLKENNELSDKFDGFFSDGSLLTNLYNFFNKEKIDRVSFDYSSIADDFLRHCEKENMQVSIIGATEKELNQAIVIFQKKYPLLNFGYNHDGYFEDSDLEKIIKYIKPSDVVIVAMGAPKQEEVAVKIFNENQHRCVITCGGFITQTSIKEDYYHPIIKKLGLRWMQRIYMHKHVRDKFLRKYPIFIFKYIFENLKIN